jgi:N-acyl homoserine lactone hydrolase
MSPDRRENKTKDRGADLVKVNLLIDGIFVTDKRLFLPEGRSVMYGAAAKSLLIQSGKQKILVDTGIGSVPDGPKFDAIRRIQTIRRTKSQGIEHQLAKVGLRPEGVTTVINTHLHNAHCGGNNLFRNAQFYVAKTEFDFIDKVVDDDPNQTAYIMENFDKVKSVNEIKGEYQLTEDVRLIPTPGHTTGHQSVVVSLAGGRKLVYSGDVAPLKENLVKRVAMTSYDREMNVGSMNKLLKIKDAKWVFSHDSSQLSLAQAFTP